MQLKLLIFCLIFLCAKGNCMADSYLDTLANFKFEKKVLYKSDTPIHTVFGFLKWYRSNKEEICTPLVKRDGKDTQGFYSVDFDAVHQYLILLKQSKFFSAVFIKDLYDYIKRCDSNFKKYPQNDFIAQGFEADLITKLMDDVDILENIESAKVEFSQINKRQAIIKLLFAEQYEMLFTLSKKKNHWLIDSINGYFPKKIQHY